VRTSKSEQVEWYNKNQNVLNVVYGCLEWQLSKPAHTNRTATSTDIRATTATA